MNYEEGYLLTKKNFKVLHKSAKQAFKNRFYGLACSLNILASEELIKSLIIFIQPYIKDQDAKPYNQIFRKHPIKHEALIEFLNSNYNSITHFESITITNLELLKSLKPHKQLEYKKQINQAQKIKDRIHKIKLFEISFEEISIWLKEANKNKNHGLYVDIQDNRWISPILFKKKKFKKERKYTKVLKLYYKNIIAFYDFADFIDKLRQEQIK